MNYSAIYYSIIEHFKTKVNRDGYYERHHIKPKCIGGRDDNDNFVLLTPKAHYVCHHLLCKMYPDNHSLKHAFAMMAVSHDGHNRDYSAKMFEIARQARSEAMRGRPMPEHIKAKLRKPKSRKENYKRPKSKQHRENISKSLSGRKKTPQHIENMIASQRDYHRGRTERFLARKLEVQKQFKELGLSRKQFADKTGIKYNTLKRYLRD